MNNKAIKVAFNIAAFIFSLTSVCVSTLYRAEIQQSSVRNATAVSNSMSNNVVFGLSLFGIIAACLAVIYLICILLKSGSIKLMKNDNIINDRDEEVDTSSINPEEEILSNKLDELDRDSRERVTLE